MLKIPPRRYLTRKALTTMGLFQKSRLILVPRVTSLGLFYTVTKFDGPKSSCKCLPGYQSSSLARSTRLRLVRGGGEVQAAFPDQHSNGIEPVRSRFGFAAQPHGFA